MHIACSLMHTWTFLISSFFCFTPSLCKLSLFMFWHHFLKKRFTCTSSYLLLYQFSSVWLLSHVRLFATPRTAACQASLSITNSQSLPKLMSVDSVMPSNHLILCCPLLLLPSILPNIRVFSNKSALCIRWPKYWSFSFNINPSNEHPGLPLGWFPLGWTGWISLQSKGLSRVFSNTTVHLRLIEAAAWIRIYFSVKFIKMHPLFCLFATLHGIWHLPNQGSNLFLLQWKLGISMRPSFWFC